MLELLFSSLIFVTSFIVVLSALVFFHELGHYSVARAFGVAVERFSIGFGKPVFRRRAKSGTEWTISRIPLGGYVKFLGDAGAASNPDTEKLEEIKFGLAEKYGDDIVKNCFHFKPLWQKVLVVAAGPFANFILAILLFAIVSFSFGRQHTETVVQSLIDGGAAQEAGVLPGDKLISMNGRNVAYYRQLASYVTVRSGEALETKIDRNGEIINLTITPQRQEVRDAIGGINHIGQIGVRFDRGDTETGNPLTALKWGYSDFWLMLDSTKTYIGRIIQGKENAKAFGGPVRVATMTGKTAVDIVKQDASLSQKIRGMIYSLLTLGAMLSIGLGVANLMPIPALDGGHLVYYGYEAVAGRPLSEEKQEFGFRIGFALLLTMLVFLTINDIGYVRSIFA